MKKILFTATLLAVSAMCASAQRQDTVRTIEMEEVQVATRASSTTPMAYTTVDRQQIQKQNYGQDMPFLLLGTPSVVATSDAGTGVGYTSIRIRGTDATRINVTANGIPMNDAESHGLFWVNFPDIASSVQDIQIQRGVGTSTNGAGAFGGSINLRTEAPNYLPYAELSGAYGSYNTHREALKIGTGLLRGKWAFDARLSNIHSDGYVKRASADLQSYFVQGAYYGPTTTVKLIHFAGKEETYHAWNGVTKEQMKTDRRYNPSGEIADRDGNLTGNYYDNQIDHYRSRNYQLLVTQRLGYDWLLNVALHYTDGYGYYEEYKNARTLKEYGLSPFTVIRQVNGLDEQVTVKKSNLIRRKMMDNGFGGGVFSFEYNSSSLKATLGGGASRYDGDHFGRVLWVEQYAAQSMLAPDHEYYFNKGEKTDANIYLKADWEAVRGLHVFGDLQYRYIRYKIDGDNDRWDFNDEIMQPLDVDNKYNFFNPKAGLFYSVNKNNLVYASVAVAHREPTRNNFTDSKPGVVPKSERLLDYEAGYRYNDMFFSAGVNLYYMQYKNQLILTGEVNHIGEPLADNVPDSYRMGIELTAGVQLTRWLRWDLHATLSRNKIKDYTEYVDNLDADGNELYTQTANYIGNTTISFSPSVIAGSIISARHGGWDIAFTSNYVSRQYMTNSEQKDISLDAYFVNNLMVNHTFKLSGLRRLTLGCTVNNIFNYKYAGNGYGGSYFQLPDPSASSQGVKRSNYAGYFPQAGINVLGNIVLRF